MGESELNTLSDGDGPEFHDALDDFPFYDCEETFSEPIKLKGGASTSVSITETLEVDKNPPPTSLRRRKSLSSRNSRGGDLKDSPMLSSSVSLEDYLHSRERKTRLSRKIKEYEKRLENENMDSVELNHSLKVADDVVNRVNDEKTEEISALTVANNDERNSSTRVELDVRENHEADSNLLFTLIGIMFKAISFQIDLLVKTFMFPIWSTYYLYIVVFHPLHIVKRCKDFFMHKMKRICSFLCENTSSFVSEWLKEHQAIWKLGLKCGWGLLWSGYVCVVLAGLLILAFVIGGLMMRVMVEEPMRVKRSLNFDYTEKSPVAFAPITAYPELSHDIYHGKMPEIGKISGSRVIPLNHKLEITVSLTLPESDYNRNLGIFQVRVDFLDNDGKVLASSRRPCMLQFQSLPIRLLLTFLKVAPILTGYTSETQNLKVKFRGFTEGYVPTSSLRVVIEQRAEFVPGAGIPEIYAASLSLESELPLLKRFLWFWKTTLFVWSSMIMFIIELFFALLCCRPIIIPKIRLREAINAAVLQNGHPVQS